MTPQETIKALTKFNKWRRGASISQPDPKDIGEAIDSAVKLLKETLKPKVTK